MVASMLLASFCLASSFVVPEMPEAEWDDTEVVTIRRASGGARRFARVRVHA